MNKILRKRHLQIWVFLAVMIPAGIITAWVTVPEKATDTLLQPGPGQSLPILLNSIETEFYTANLKSTSDKSQYQLEWINKKNSLFPSSLVYQKAIPENELIGRIDARGAYFFPLRMDSLNSYHFILYDIIKNLVIDSLKFGQ